MTGLRAFFARRRAEKQKRIDEEYTTMTDVERDEIEAGAHGGAIGEGDAHLEHEAARDEDVWEGRPPRES